MAGLDAATSAWSRRRSARHARVYRPSLAIVTVALVHPPKEPSMTLAIWCVLVAAFLPYFPFGLARRRLDPHAPRLNAAQLDGLAARADGAPIKPGGGCAVVAARAYGAHLNAFEAFPFFAAAVIVSQIVEGASATVGGLALAFVMARIGHIAFYLADRPPLRSACFTLGLALTLVIFIHPAFH
jgi:uncharacterized MAPEG superfamily protein